jgi:hypothetical protein
VGRPDLVPNSVGLYLHGPAADTFVDHFETSYIAQPVWVVGASTDSWVGWFDVHIRRVIADQYSGNAGVEIDGVPEYGVIELEDIYVAPSQSDTVTAGVCVSSSKASVKITGGQAICATNPTAIGLYVTNSQGVHDRNFTVMGSKRPFVWLSSQLCSSDSVAVNPGEHNETTTEAAYYISGCSRLQIRGHVQGNGASGTPTGYKYTYGINVVDAATTCCLLDPSGIDPQSVNGGANNKVVVNGVQVTTPGQYLSHYVTGLMG